MSYISSGSAQAGFNLVVLTLPSPLEWAGVIGSIFSTLNGCLLEVGAKQHGFFFFFNQRIRPLIICKIPTPGMCEVESGITWTENTIAHYLSTVKELAVQAITRDGRIGKLNGKEGKLVFCLWWRTSSRHYSSRGWKCWWEAKKGVDVLLTTTVVVVSSIFCVVSHTFTNNTQNQQIAWISWILKSI